MASLRPSIMLSINPLYSFLHLRYEPPWRLVGSVATAASWRGQLLTFLVLRCCSFILFRWHNLVFSIPTYESKGDIKLFPLGIEKKANEWRLVPHVCSLRLHNRKSQVNVYAKFEKIPSKCSLDVVFIRIGETWGYSDLWPLWLTVQPKTSLKG